MLCATYFDVARTKYGPLLIKGLHIFWFALNAFNSFIIRLKGSWSYIKLHLSKWRSCPIEGNTCKPCRGIAPSWLPTSQAYHFTKPNPPGAPHSEKRGQKCANRPVLARLRGARVSFDGDHRRRHFRGLCNSGKYEVVQLGRNIQYWRSMISSLSWAPTMPFALETILFLIQLCTQKICFRLSQ